MEDKQYYVDIISGQAERTIKRLWIVIVLLVVLLVATNGAWLWYESQYENTSMVVTQDVEADGDSDINLRNIGGDYYGGASETDSYDQEENP